MSDEEEVTATEFLADMAVALIHRDMLSGDEWRPAYTLGAVLDAALEAVQDTESYELREFGVSLVAEIANTLLYAHVHEELTPEGIDAEVKNFAKMFDEVETTRLGGNEIEDEEEN